MKRTLHIIIFALAALITSTTASAVTQYCGESVQSTIDNKSVSVNVTILKVGNALRVSFESDKISGIRNGGTFQNWGTGGTWNDQNDATENFEVGWTQNGSTWTKDFTFTTYPTSGTGQIYCLFDLVEGTPKVAGFTLTDVDLSNTSCDGSSGSGDSGNSGDSGDSNEPEYPTPPAESGIDWSTTYDWVNHVSYTSYKEQFKVQTGCASPIEIQNISGIGIYMTFSKAIKSCSISSHFEGSGLWLYLDALTAEETYVTVIFQDDTQCSFWVYNAYGASSAPATTIDWDAISTWVNHNGSTEYENQFKSSSTCCEVCYLQDYNSEKCIYVRFPREITTCNIPHYKEAGQLYIPLTSLEAIETPITVKLVTGEICSFYLYNAKGTASSTIVPGLCTYTGEAGDGLMSQPGKDPFETGYEVSLQLDATKENILVTAITKDGAATRAVFQNYYTYIEKEANNEQYMVGQNTDQFTLTVPVSWINNQEDGIIRFAIKFEYESGVIKVTTPEYFYLDGSGCAQRVFAIYHHDDFPATPVDGEDAFTQFEGGRILQPIQYKRLLRPDAWETFCVPFDVDSVTVYDTDDQQNYQLYAQYNNGGTTYEGHFWLREFTTKEVTREQFQPNWYDITATSQADALPKKDVPYIIRVPAGDYYADKYVVFHGRGYQTIASEFNDPTLPTEDDMFSYFSNNTMMPQTLTSAYVLESSGYYFLANTSGVTLHPFECAVGANQKTVARMPRLAFNGRGNTTTDLSPLPTTDLSNGVIYTLFGAVVAEFHSLEQYDAVRTNLPAGIYIVSTPTTVTKICIQ